MLYVLKEETILSADKVIVTAFWEACVIIFVDYLKKRKTITGKYYVDLLQRLADEIEMKVPAFGQEKSALPLKRTSNAPVHALTVATTKIYEFGFELLPHSLDIAR